MGGREVVLLFECADRQQILICRSPPCFFFSEFVLWLQIIDALRVVFSLF